jgi:hypothetical protein
MPAGEEIAMADPEDSMQPEGALPEGRPRRPPPIIDGKAIEISAGGPQAATDGTQQSRAEWPLTRMIAFLTSWRGAAVAAAGLIAVVIAGAAWIYPGHDGSNVPLQTTASPAPAPSGDSPAHPAGAETAARTPPDRTAGTQPDSAALENRLAGMDSSLAALNDRIATLERSVRDATAAARVATERAERAAGLLDQARKNGDEQEAAQQIDRGALDDLAGRIKALEARQMTLRQIQERLDRLASMAGAPDVALRAVVAATALRNAVERDRPYAAELAAARTLGLDEGPLALLEPFAATGLPKRHELFNDLSVLLPELRRVSQPPGQDLSYLDRLQTSAARMLNIRPVKDEPGDDPPTILSRIEFKMVQQDVDVIIAELDKLPAEAREIAKPWRTKASARRDALDAVRLLATTSLAKLGEASTSGSSPQ